MIQVTQIIDYIRPLMKQMSINVDGAAALAAAKDDSRIMTENGQTFVTSLFVMLGDFVATTDALETYEQKYEERLVIFACINNTLDRTGKYAQQYVYNLRLALFSMLLNYEYDEDSHNLQYVGDRMSEMDRARYWHRFEFKLNGRLAPEDGVGIANLTNFNEYVANWNSSDPLADNPLAVDDLIPLYDIPS